MHTRSAAANLLWAGASARAWWRFRSDLRDPLRLQHQLLLDYLRENRDTDAGKRCGFADILRGARGRDNGERMELVDTFRRRVPIAHYDDLEPMIHRIARGEANVLTSQPVRRLVPSSGSAAAAKLIPYTARLQQEISCAVDAWIADLFRDRPELMAGRAYWSITPTERMERIDTAVPVGFDEDSAYLGGARQALARMILAVPEQVGLLADVDDFRHATLLFLLRARDLRLISVWHPSYLERLLDTVPAHLDGIIDDLERGTVTLHAPTSARTSALLKRALRPDPARAAELRALRSTSVTALWPCLSLISCWADGPARRHQTALADRLEHVPIQPKGLIATEGVVSIPLAGRHPLAIRSHFFEFIDAAGRSRLAHELDTGAEYSVVITTGGGLYRYRLGDRVRVDGWVSATPSLRFVGRDDRVSDRCGEKLSDGFVAGVLERLFEGRPAPRFAMLAPEETASGIAYTLLVDDARAMPDGSALERELRRNPHYAWCVDLGQLRPARVVRVAPGADRAYVGRCVARGQRLGDVKPVSLHCDSGWEAFLTRAVPVP